MTTSKRWAAAEVVAIFALVMLDIWVFEIRSVPWLLAIFVLAGVIVADFVARVRSIKKEIPGDLDPASRKALVAKRIGDCTQELGIGRWRSSAENHGPYLEYWDFSWVWRLVRLVILALAVILIAGYFLKPQFWQTKDFWKKKIYDGMLVYSFWGLGQQFVLHGCVTSKLYSIFTKSADVRTIDRKAAYLTALCVGVLFFLAHMPNPTLMVVTPIAGAVTAYIFLNCRNVMILGIAHGVLGNTVSVCLAHGLRVGWHYWR